MCGIVGYTGVRSAAPILLDGLKKLEYRGYDSAGIAVMKDDHIILNKVTGRIANLYEKTKDGKDLSGYVGIGHTRWATHGAPTYVNAHPHLSNDGNFAVVHNGIIENYMALREELLEKGYSFKSETDTEVVAHLLEMYYSGDVQNALRKTCARIQGAYALGVMCSDQPHKLFVTRQSSPIIVGIGTGENFFASDVTALLAYTRNIVHLEDGQFAEITSDAVRVFDAAGQPMPSNISCVTWNVEAAEKGEYEHFMLKEIMEQPNAVNATITPRIKEGGISLDEIELTEEYLQDIHKIVITACGSAYYAGFAGKYALEKLCRIPVQVELASELRYSDPLINKHTLLIVLSQSGETADTIAAMKECRQRGAKTLAIVNVVGSTIANMADHTLYTWAGPEIAVATTKGYTTQLSVLYLFALYLAKRLNRIDDHRYRDLVLTLKSLPKRIRESLDMNGNVEKLAKKYSGSESLFFIGRNSNYAVALEGALKMKEISYIHAEAYAAGELKHGTIALIHEHQPVIAVCSNEESVEKTLNNIVEVKSRGAMVLAVVLKSNTKVLSVADDVLFVPVIESIFSAIVEIVPLQLLAYYVAKEKGCDIDKPKNLAKSVTVE